MLDRKLRVRDTRAKIKPWVRSGAILGVVDFLKRNGYDPKRIVSAAALKMAEATDPYRLVDLHTVMAIFQAAADESGRPDIGLALGLSVDLKQIGPFGYLFLNAPTVGAALSACVRHAPAFQSQAHFALHNSRNWMTLEYSSNHTEIEGWEIDSEVTIGYLMAIVNGVARRKIVPHAVAFDHAPICTAQDYARLLSVPATFGQRVNRLVFPVEIYDESVPDADALLHSIMHQHIEDLAQAVSADAHPIVDIIMNNIRRGLPNDTASLGHVASELGIGTRNLQRRLHEAGTSYQKCCDKVRHELAIYYLTKTTLSLTDIALELGYAEASVFSRAFKRWVGCGPREYRQRRLM